MAGITVNLATLNPSQKEAVLQIEGPVLILAGAGSGKTRVVTTRIAHMISSGISPSKICAVTFTNKAANEMRERVGHFVPSNLSKGLTVSTFHSLCVKILRSGIEKLGYKSNFTIYTGSDQIGLLKQIIVRKAGKEEKLDAWDALSLISRWKNTGKPVSDSSEALISVVAKEYQRQLKLHNAVDFDDLLGLTCQLFEEHGDIRATWNNAFHYVMVDEFQDTNKQQMALVKHVVGTRRNICVVGDDDQSIYGWRGAELANILEFERFFPDPKVIRLQENYRSQGPILEAANAVIKHNRGRREKRLIATKPGNEPVRLISMPGDTEEAEFIVNEIWEANTMQRRAWEDCAILFRTNSQTRVFEEAFRKLSIPYRILGGQSFYERREVKDVLSYLNVATNPADDVNLLRVINNTPRGIGETTVGVATEFSIEHKIPVYAALKHPDCAKLFSNKTQGAIKTFIEMVERWRVEFDQPSVNYAAKAESLLKEIGYLAYLKRNCATPEEELNREQNVREFIQTIYRHHAKGAKGLRDYLDTISLDDERFGDDKEKAAKKPGVWLITLHASKGLEFPIVYLVGLEEGILPHKRSIEEGTREEERRLLYVGITRAMERLTMSYCHSRIKYGQPSAVMPSSFIRELPSPPVQKMTYEEIQARPATKEQAKSNFAAIKAMLGAK